jgi:cyclic pyranopterin phosphate synthase
MTDKLTHLDETGAARMVDVGDKPVSRREAIARGTIYLQPGTIRAIANGSVPKGDVIATARLAGIMAAKRCGELIPLCHPLSLESVEVDFDIPNLPTDVTKEPLALHIKAITRITAKTGVEMEALAAVSVAALTIYDMCKAIDKTMRIDGVTLVAKTKTPV